MKAWGIIFRLQAELKRQETEGGLRRVAAAPDDFGRIEVDGTLDLAALAAVASEALQDEQG